MIRRAMHGRTPRDARPAPRDAGRRPATAASRCIAAASATAGRFTPSATAPRSLSRSAAARSARCAAVTTGAMTAARRRVTPRAVRRRRIIATVGLRRATPIVVRRRAISAMCGVTTAATTAARHRVRPRAVRHRRIIATAGHRRAMLIVARRHAISAMRAATQVTAVVLRLRVKPRVTPRRRATTEAPPPRDHREARRDEPRYDRGSAAARSLTRRASAARLPWPAARQFMAARDSEDRRALLREYERNARRQLEIERQLGGAAPPRISAVIARSLHRLSRDRHRVTYPAPEAGTFQSRAILTAIFGEHRIKNGLLRQARWKRAAQCLFNQL